MKQFFASVFDASKNLGELLEKCELLAYAFEGNDQKALFRIVRNLRAIMDERHVGSIDGEYISSDQFFCALSALEHALAQLLIRMHI